MRANIETTQNPVARPATAERLRSEYNGGVVLAKTIVIVLAEDVLLDGEGTLNSWDGLIVEGVMTKVLEFEDVVKFGLIKPGG